MGSPDSDYLSSLSDEASPELYEATELLDDASDGKGAEIGSDGERLNLSPRHTFSSGFSSHWTQPWSTNIETSRSPQKCEWSLPLENGPSIGPVEKSAGVGADLSLSDWPPQNNTKLPLVGAGMENLGNTCFLNSVLQCFIHTVPLLHGVMSNGHVHTNSRVLFAMRPGELIVCSFTNRLVFPCNLADNLSYISSSFKRFQQEDAHEFLQCFLDRLENCHNSESNGCMSSKSDNIVKQVFGGCLVSNLKCCNCGHCSDTYEPSIDLSLEIEDADNLLTALQSFTKVERIEDPDTKFTCEKCKEQVSVEKKLSFDHAPSVAVFHLKRFKNDGCFVQKIDKHVAFPLDLDVLPFTGSGEKNDVELKYVLYAVVVHVGWTSTSGHYYCFIRVSPNMWCKFDDSRVMLVDEDFVLSQDAYILFYTKQSTPWFSSFIENQKEIVHSTIWNNSPKSVLDNLDTSSASPSLGNEFAHNPGEVSHNFGSEDGKADNNEIEQSEPMQNIIESTGSTCHLHGMSYSVALGPSDSSDVSLPITRKASLSFLEKVDQNLEVPSLANCQNDAQTALRSPSPEIYREDPPDAVYTIPRDHLRSVDRASCKRRLDKDMDEVEHKQARSFMKKNMHSSRRQQLLAAMGGQENEASMNKKTRRSGLSNDRPPFRPLVAGTNR